MDTAVTVARLYLSESDHGRRKNLLRDIFAILQDQHRVKGTTVFRGIAGFGDTGEVHAADLLRLTVDLPLVVEFFDTQQAVEAVLPLLRELLPDGHVITWSALQHQA